MKGRPHPSHRAANAPRGFTIVEALLVLAMIAILAALAYPSYLAQLHKSRRLDAFVALAGVQQAQERWRASHGSFAADLATLGLPATVANRYRLEITDNSAHGYAAVATAIESQAADTACGNLGVVQRAGQTLYTSSGSASPAQCWGR